MSNARKSHTRTAHMGRCQICGDTAYYSYFGVLSCQTCKMFFKRYGNMNRNTFVCSNDHRCFITKENRHLCRACRLEKCFRVGMLSERIRQGNFKKRSRRQNSGDVENSIVFDGSTRLNNIERIFMGNICHFYEISPLFQLAHSIKSASTSNFEQSIEKLIHLLYESAGQSFRNLTNFHQLSYSDRSVLLHSSAENVIYFASVYLFGQSKLLDHQPTMNYLKHVYGLRSLTYFQKIVQFSRFDLIPFQLAILLCSISNNALIFHSTLHEEYEDIRSILDLENKVVNILWNYLMKNYSCHQAVRLYFKMIELLMTINIGIATARNTGRHLTDFESFVERTVLNLFLDDLDRIDNSTSEYENI